MKTTIFAFLIALFLSTDAIPQSTQTAVFNLTWTDTNTTQQGFNIERSATQTGTFTKIGTTAATVKAYTDTVANDPGNAQKCYRVAAYNTAGQGPYSNTACATSPTVIVPPVNPPAGLAVTVQVTVTQTSGAPAPLAAPQKAKK
jgi:hypothetical protein